MSDHVAQVLSACSSSIFALRLLRNHDLRSDQLHLVARATTIASILYATPGWWGFAGVGDRQSWNCWWPDCGVWVTFQWIFRASRLSPRRLTETYSSQFHNVLTSYGIYSPTSPPLRDPSVLGRITSYCPLKTIGIFFLGHYG